MDMQHYTLSLFGKDDTRFELRILDAQRQILYTSAPIEASDIDPLQALVADHYRVTAPDLRQQGQALFNWVDQYSGGWLRRVRLTPQPMALTIDMQVGGLRHLPWELLHDGQQFLCADPLHLFTPLRRAADSEQVWQAEKRRLSLLFMASSPESVEPVLDFEAEEAAILHATERQPLDLQVEESGSLQGLQACLTDRDVAPDILHLTGHADVKADQPVFLLEDDLGELAVITPNQLARSLADSGHWPRIAFLSGCRTGQSNAQQDMLSFSEYLVQAGVPIVLGWALPVGDGAASEAAAVLYAKLCIGFEIADAVAAARQQLYENQSPYWHLLRGYVDASPLPALIAQGRQRRRVHNTRQQFLDAGGQVPVCARTQFIGRRRLLQRCLRALRTYFGSRRNCRSMSSSAMCAKKR